jgi:zinc transporter
MTSQLNWTHVNFSDPTDATWIRKESGISPIVAEALLSDESRPRALHLDEGILIILRGVNLNPGSEVEDMISVRLWLEKDRVVTASRRPLKSLDLIRKQNEQGQGPGSPGAFALELINRLSKFIGEVTDGIESKIEEAEDHVNDAGSVLKNSPFSVVRRQSARIRRYLAPQREALDSLVRHPEPVFNKSQVAELREQMNRITLVLEDLDLARERALVAQEEFLGLIAHEQNNRMLLLSIVAAIFLPLSFLTGLMGMNVAGLPGTENSWAFGIIVVLMTLIAVLILLLFRARKWL